ncbi:MAG: DUF423 domain-containing protein [Candidatus Devosia phytovorans]|uniref:DUF423 domain-containing protein n=1 Tax=Candidatus Devosia phytovorans TaxID=3121372 RepID=A0AAJ5VXT5_9HYPH|nr:DUF423 domain-containing protein [Devosia sp.]WEK05478.1 MAG: DUF423 domain-containing protein [Devosia sp.]
MGQTDGWGRRVLLAAAGLVGAVGVASAAASSHGDSRNLGSIAMICLAHGPALLALALAGRGRLLRFAGWILLVGTALFAGDLAVREWLGHGLFPGAAPIGGIGLIGGWATIILAGLTGRMR